MVGHGVSLEVFQPLPVHAAGAFVRAPPDSLWAQGAGAGASFSLQTQIKIEMTRAVFFLKWEDEVVAMNLLSTHA